MDLINMSLINMKDVQKAKNNRQKWNSDSLSKNEKIINVSWWLEIFLDVDVMMKAYFSW